MEAMRQSWTDDKLEGLSERVDLGFKHVDQCFEQVDQRFDDGFKHVDQRFDMVDARLDRLEAKFDDLQRTLLQGCLGLIGTLIVTGGAIVATQL